MEKFSKEELKVRLDSLVEKYNVPQFVDNDPISIPHRFSRRGDIEVSAFLISIIAWGNRKAILKSGKKMLERLDFAPEDFIRNSSEAERQKAAEGFVHRTLSSVDFLETLNLLSAFYRRGASLGDFFEESYMRTENIKTVLSLFRSEFLCDTRSLSIHRHISSVDKGSACKRLCMMLRWMVRCDGRGVDFGLWDKIPPSALYIPLDVHSARQGRLFGLLERKSNDWRAAEELTQSLRELDPLDPTKYDFALFGLGAIGE